MGIKENLPKGAGLNKKWFVVLVTGVATILIIVIILITMSRKVPAKQQAGAPQGFNTDASLAEQMVDQTETQHVNNNLTVSDAMSLQQSNTLSGTSATSSGTAPAPIAATGAPLVQHHPQYIHNGRRSYNSRSYGVGLASAHSQQIQAGERSDIVAYNNFKPDMGDSNSGSVNNTEQELALLKGSLPHNISLPQNLNGDAGVVENSNPMSQNMQQQKEQFMKGNQKPGKFYMSSVLQKPVSPYEVKATTLIPATLITGINSDLPGEISAQVRQNVYDTVTGNYLLIPQGTRIVGVYDNQVAYGQERVLMAWNRLIFPNGDSFDLQGQPGIDLKGMAGMTDLVDQHLARVFGSVIAISIFGAIGQLSQNNAQGAYPTNGQIIYSAVGQNLVAAGTTMLQKNLDIQPTIEIRPGANFNVLVTKDMVLPGPYKE